MRRGRPQFYRLVGRLPVPEADPVRWARELAAHKIVRQDQVGPLLVSTVFLGIDHSYGLTDPLLFETMIFGAHDRHEFASDYCVRYHTWDQAERGHEAALDHARAALAAADEALKPKD